MAVTEESQMDAWFARDRPKRKQRKQRSDKGTSKRKATAARRFDGMPQYVDMEDVDDLDGGFSAEPAADDDGARSSSAGCAEQRREADTRMESPSRSSDRSMPSQEEMDAAETSSPGRAPEQRRQVNSHSQTRGARHHLASHPAKPIEDLHELTSQQIMERARKHLEDKERRAAKRRDQTEQAKRKADERSQNMPSKALLREAAGRSQVTSHISTAQAATGPSRRRTSGVDMCKSYLSGRCATRAQRSQRCWRGLECSHRHCW